LTIIDGLEEEEVKCPLSQFVATMRAVREITAAEMDDVTFLFSE
jgi:hypothetical protein